MYVFAAASYSKQYMASMTKLNKTVNVKEERYQMPHICAPFVKCQSSISAPSIWIIILKNELCYVNVCACAIWPKFSSVAWNMGTTDIFKIGIQVAQ